MITLLGDQTSALNLNCKTTENISVFIDKNKHSFEEILRLQPESTYIITTRKYAEMLPIIEKGFYNILPVNSVESISERSVEIFISTKYIDNKLIISANFLSKIYSKYGAAVETIKRLLTAIKDNDMNTYTEIAQTGLTSLVDSLSSIEEMLIFSRNLVESKESYSTLVKKSEEFSKLLEQLEQTSADKKISDAEITKLQTSNKELRTIIDSHAAKTKELLTDDNLKKLPLFKKMEEESNVLQRKIAELTEQTAELKEKAELAELRAIELQNDKEKDNVISTLKTELNKVMQNGIDYSTKLPVISDNTTLSAEFVVYLKEIRSAIYINALVVWIDNYLKVNLQKKRGADKSHLIVILDSMQDSFTLQKYQKRGFSVNVRPIKSQNNLAVKNVVVTNTTSWDKLRTDLEINTYDVLVFVDRLHARQDYVKLKSCNKYYLVNTQADINDFKLLADKCIGFMDKNSLQKNLPCPGYYVYPTGDLQLYGDVNRRAGKFTQEKEIPKIFASYFG